MVLGQDAALDAIVPAIETWQANLAPNGRPAGVFLLLGPTGSGKTYTVEAVAQALHGSGKQLLRVDCGEYQMEHEVAKLVGAPPGYLGHRETQALLTQARLNAVTSAGCSLAVVLFDEIEKAAASMTRLLLGILDKAHLRLGDNSQVNFENTLVFMTSNVGAQEVAQAHDKRFNMEGQEGGEAGEDGRRMQRAARRVFAPEFLNRCDAVLTYAALDKRVAERILERQIAELQAHFHARLAPDEPLLTFSESAREFLLDTGFSAERGAREIRRAVEKHVLRPVAAMVIEGKVRGGMRVKVERGKQGLEFRVRQARA